MKGKSQNGYFRNRDLPNVKGPLRILRATSTWGTTAVVAGAGRTLGG